MTTQNDWRKRIMSYSKKKLGAERAYRYRSTIFEAQEQVFKQTRKLTKFPQIRPEIVLTVNDRKLALTCRFIDPQHATERLGLRYADHSTQWIDDHIVHFRSTDNSLTKFALAPDTADQFAGLIECKQSVDQIIAVIMQLKNGKTKQVTIKAAPVVDDPLPTVKHLLNLIPAKEGRKRHLYDHAIGKMISELWGVRNKTQSCGELVAYNEQYEAEQPVVSLIIPIYGRYDFISHQLAQFASDPDMHKHEIIYVIDDPRLAVEIRETSHYLAPILHVAFKVLYLEKNLGYAGANNAGVRVAKADKLLLLNSDVFPCKAGWLSQLVDNAGESINDTLVGARLLYEDESIQHDGMSFNQVFWLDNLWINEHYGKGLPVNLFDCADTLQPRECVTGACMLLTKANYNSLGGLDEDYILGDFEDSDLCMKARGKGLQIVIAEHITLYHLERQSQVMVTADRWKTELTYYNCWQHNNKWDSRIVELKQEMLNA